MSIDSPQPERRALLQNALAAVEKMQAKLDAYEQAKREPIAIIGMSCRFPGGANTPEAYWQLLHDGVDAVTEIPADRKNMQEYIRSATDAGGQDIHWYGGFVEGIDQFDPQFFGLAPREATLMDPQQRMILEVSWEALERAGQAPDRLKGSLTGIFIGITTNDYGQLTLSTDPSQLDAYTATGGALNVAPGRVAYTLGLQGPSMAIDTACSSSLVAVHLACQSLRNGESNLALAGGVNVLLRPEAFVCFNRWGMMSPAGFCKTFDAGADGFVRGEGCGIIVLKRLSDAITSGDPILAVIRGSAVNQDGRSSGLTVPNGLAQAAVIRTALANAGVQPAKVSYVETHGTGTSLGDPIEVEALGSVLGEGRSQDQPLFLSSVKTNIGHLESAAGMAGLIKVVLAMQNKEIPPHLHLQERSPRIPWPDFPTLIPTQPSPWTADNNSRIAGVSSFGFSGTNAHIVLEEAPALELSQAEIGWPAHLLTLSAKSEPALKQLAARFAQHLTSHPSQSLADVSFTANTGRAQFPHRLAIVAESNEEARKALTAFSSDHEAAGLTAGQIQEADQDKLAFLFTGQGSQYVGMGRQLYETEPAFRQALNQCDELLRPYLHRSILNIIYPDHSESGEPNLLDQTAYTQPALFALEYSLAQLWQSWGIRPAAVMGHSVGEYVAACIAGVFSLEDGLRLIAERGRLMQALPAGGKMAAIFSDRLKVAEVIKPYKEQVSIAAINGPENIVISGAGRAIDTIVETLTEQGISSKYLTVSHAFHSPLMDPILGEFLQIANRIRFNPPKIDLISNISGQPVGEEIVTPDYWQKHVRTPVLFADSIQTLHDQGCRIFLEIGPKPTLLSMGQRCIPDTKSKDQWLPSLRPGQGDWQSLLQTLGTLFVQGINIDWPGFEQTHAKSRQRLILPSYPFQRERYWIDYQKAQNIGPHRTLHPLVHEAMPSPFLQDTVYLSHLAVDSPAYLDDHRVFDLPIFPGTAYLEVMLAATGLALGWKEISLVDVQIERAMTLPENGERLIQTAVSPIQNGQATVRIFSQNENDTWQEHATAIVKPGSPSDLETDPLSLITARCTQEVTPSAYYQQLSDIGLAYGASFCGIQSIQRRDGEAIARVQLPEDVPMAGYSLHPALLDACLQVLGTTLPTLEDRTPANVYVPIGISHFQVFQPGETNLICHASLEVGQGQSEILRGNLRLFDERGVLIALVEGIQLKSISQRDLEQLARKPIADLLYHLRWQPSSGTTATGDLTGHWLILADLEGTGSALAKRLEQSGATTTILTPNDFAVLDPQAYISVLNQVTELGKRSLRGIVHLWGLLEKEISLEASHWGYASALFLAQACLKTASPPRLWFITQGAQAVPENTKDMVHPAQSALWGFARTLALEHGDLRPVILDLEMGAQTPEATIFAELANDDGENQVAWRVGKRYVARLARHQSEADALILPDKPFELIASQQGLLDLISVRLKTTRPPGLREVEIAVHAAGLNFRDVLNALGMYPGQAGKLGNECVGVVTAIGEDVSNVKVGDAVMALASGTFAPTVVAQSEFVFPIPANLSFIESATIPITFLTAYYGLHHLAKIRSGDRILIHAAAGGVGLAAVQLAQRAGAIIYATAGSPEKRAFLRSLGVQYIMNSRSLDFAEEIMTATNGEGVNIVLNALAGDFIQKSFSVLADNGRFLEMGKRDIWTHEQVTAFNRTLAYYPYDLADVTGGMPHLIGEMFSDLKAEFEAGMLSPLPQTTFPMSRAREAFRFMSRAHHTGKIVIVPEQLPTLPANATYLITGGLGGLGLALAQKLAERGARHLVLISRSEPSTAALTQSEKLRAEGVNVVVAKADVAVMAEMKQVLDQIDSGMPPLRGIIHAAGVVADGTLSNQTWAQFESVMRPKMLGAMHLDTLTRHQPLDFFVLFSAGASLLGSRGQVNYSAANAFLDGFAHYRRAHGLPALSINWGGWSQVGMAARLNPEINRRRELQGIRMVSPEEGLHIFENLVNQNLPQIGVIPIEWATFARQLEDRAAYSILADLIQSEQPRQETSTQVVTPRIRQQLDALPPRERLQALQTHVKEHLIAVLALKPNHRLDMRQGFAEMGMDSLMAVELSRRLQRSLDCVLPTTLAFEYPTVEALTNYLATEILGIIVADANRKPTKGVEKQSVMDEVDEVPEDQLEDALLKELKDAGY